MDISVIICTYNRCGSLKRTLQTICLSTIPAGISWELFVVDNNSKDSTERVCRNFAEKLPLRYLFEGRQGKSHALNTSIAIAKGDLLLFTDDDVDVDPEWITSYWAASMRHPGASIFGGAFPQAFEKPPPAWFAATYTRIFPPADFGDTERELRVCFPGANLAIRRSAVLRYLPFRIDLGPDGTDTIRSEETDLQNRMQKDGHRTMYVPGAIITHRLPPERATQRFIWRWHKGLGMAEARLGEVPSASPWFGIPRYYWRLLLANAFVYSFGRFLLPPRVWVSALAKVAHAWGIITELRHLSHKSRPNMHSITN